MDLSCTFASHNVMELRDALGEFERHFDRLRQAYASASVRIVSHRMNTNLYLLAGDVILTTSPAEVGTSVAFDVADIVGIEEVVRVEDLPERLRQLVEARISVGDSVVQLKEVTGYSAGLFTGRHSGPLDLGMPYAWLRIEGKAIQHLISEREVQTRLERLGYRGLEGLTQELLGREVYPSHGLFLNVVAPIFVDCVIESGQRVWSIHVHVHSRYPRKALELVYFTDEVTNALRNRVTLDTIEPKDHSPTIDEYVVEVKMRKKTQLKCRVYWGEHSEPLASSAAASWQPPEVRGNVGWSLLSSLMKSGKQSGREVLERYLGIVERDFDQDKFEGAILNLLGAAGFAVLDFGKRFGVPGLDMIALSGNYVLAVSCVSDNQIGKRLTSLLNELPIVTQLAPRMTVRPVIISRAERTVVRESEIQDAKAAGVGVLLRSDIEQLVKIVSTVEIEEVRPAIIRLVEERGGQKSHDLMLR